MQISVSSILTIEAALDQLAAYVVNNITLQNVDAQQNTLQAIRQTLINLISIIDAYSIQVVATSEYTNLTNINNALLNISQQDLLYVSNRLTALKALFNTVYTLPTWLDFEISNLDYGNPAIQGIDLISYFCTFQFEPVPPGLNSTNLGVISEQAATAWLDVLNYIFSNGTLIQLTAYDSVNRMFQSSQDTADFVNNLTLSSSFQDSSSFINLFGAAIYFQLGGQLPTSVTNGNLQFVGGGYGSESWTTTSYTGAYALEFSINNGGVIGSNNAIPNLFYQIQGNEMFTAWINVQDVTPDEILLQFYSGGVWKAIYWGATENFNQFTGINPYNIGVVPTPVGQWIGLTFPLSALGLGVGAVITGVGWGIYKANGTSTVIFSDINSSFQSSTTSFQLLWNSIVALPSLLRVCSLLTNDPSVLNWQQLNAVRFLTYLMVLQTNTLLTSFGVPNTTTQPTLVALRMGETLLDFAARTTGDVTQWTQIAAINGLTPPYVGMTPAPGIATPGTRLYLPPGPSAINPISDYNTTFLGTDINLGPVTQPLTIWTGDFATISGLNNYIYALYRRVLTPIGSLIYHTVYGSQLPAQVGRVSTASEAGLLSGYLKSTLASDPRTGSVNKIVAIPITQDQVALISSVTPIGGVTSTNFNLILVKQIPAINASQAQA